MFPISPGYIEYVLERGRCEVITNRLGWETSSLASECPYNIYQSHQEYRTNSIVFLSLQDYLEEDGDGDGDDVDVDSSIDGRMTLLMKAIFSSIGAL